MIGLLFLISLACTLNNVRLQYMPPNKGASGMPHLEDDMIGHKGVRSVESYWRIARMVLQPDEQRDEQGTPPKKLRLLVTKAAMKWNTTQLGVKRL